MNLKAIEIQIYFEIAMAIGTSLDLESNLKTALSAYLRKLGCATGMVLQFVDEDDHIVLNPCFSIPRNTLKNPVYNALIQQLPAGMSKRELVSFTNSLPIQGTIRENLHFAVTLLPGYGILVLLRGDQPLSVNTLHSLRQLNRKLADSCISCLQKEKIEAINSRLNHEIHQRRVAENKLQDLLNYLEDKVTERSKELQKSQLRFQALFDNIQDIFFSLDLEGRILEISPSVEQTLLYPRKRLLGRTISFFGFAREDIDRFMQQLLKKGKVKDFEMEVQARDGITHQFSLNAIYTENSQDPPVQIIGSMRDITQQRNAERTQKELENQLLNSRKMEALGLLAGGVAHDLNNVLSGIVSYPDLLLNQLEEDHPLTQPIKMIRDSGKKAAAIVQDLLTMARRNVPHKDVFNINLIIKAYLASPEFDKLIEHHPGLEISTDLCEELLNIEGSVLHMKTAFMNLFHNAAEAESTRIHITTDNAYLEGESARHHKVREGEYVLVTITDNGIGLSAEEQERIFEPFYTKKVMGKSGTGLGMSVVWGTIQDHKGYITINSKKNTGTSFNLYLCGSRKQLKQIKPEPPKEEYLAQGESVLVVDDSEDQRFIAKAMLEELNYTVYTAASGEATVDLLPDLLPDLVLLDMIMEDGIDGLDTYRRIRQLRPEQKVIIVSGYSETNRVQEALRLGALKYIRKPYLLNAFGQALRKCFA